MLAASQNSGPCLFGVCANLARTPGRMAEAIQINHSCNRHFLYFGVVLRDNQSVRRDYPNSRYGERAAWQAAGAQRGDGRGSKRWAVTLVGPCRKSSCRRRRRGRWRQGLASGLGPSQRAMRRAGKRRAHSEPREQGGPGDWRDAIVHTGSSGPGADNAYQSSRAPRASWRVAS